MMGIDVLASILLAWTAITKYQTRCLNNNMVSESGSPRSWRWWDWALMKPLSLISQMAAFSLCPQQFSLSAEIALGLCLF